MKQLLLSISFILTTLLFNPIYSQELAGVTKTQIKEALQGRWEWSGRIKINDNNYINSHAKLIIDGDYITEYTDGVTSKSVIRNIDINSKKIHYGEDTYLEFDIDNSGIFRLYGDKKRNIQFKKTSNSTELSESLTNQIKQSERRGLPLSDIRGLEMSGVLNGQSHSIGYTDRKKDPSISASVIKKNSQEGYWVCTWSFNFEFDWYGNIVSKKNTSYSSRIITIPSKIRLGDYEWSGDVASPFDFSRPKSFFSNKIVWVNCVRITPPENVTKIVFEDGYIKEALIQLSASSKIKEIHLPRSLKDIELFVNGLQTDVLIFLPVEEPWETIDGKRVSLFGNPPTEEDWITVNGKRTLTSDYNSKNAPFNEKIVFIVPKGSVEKYRKLERFKNARIFSSVEEYESDKKIQQERKKEEQRRKDEQERLRIEKECQQLANGNKHLFTSDELDRIERGSFPTSNFKNDITERQEIFDIISHNPDVFSADYYYEIITKTRDGNLLSTKTTINDSLEKYRLAENYNKLLGNWKANTGKRNACKIISKNNQHYLTLKYDGEKIFEGIIENNYNNIRYKVTAKEIVVDIVINIESKSQYKYDIFGTKYWSTTEAKRFHFYYNNGRFMLDDNISGRVVNLITFSKK